MREIDTVVHLAWEKDQEGHSKAANLLLVKNLISKMEEAGTKRLILLAMFQRRLFHMKHF